MGIWSNISSGHGRKWVMILVNEFWATKSFVLLSRSNRAASNMLRYWGLSIKSSHYSSLQKESQWFYWNSSDQVSCAMHLNWCHPMNNSWIYLKTSKIRGRVRSMPVIQVLLCSEYIAITKILGLIFKMKWHTVAPHETKIICLVVPFIELLHISILAYFVDYTTAGLDLFK